jgi:hypothetical protein
MNAHFFVYAILVLIILFLLNGVLTKGTESAPATGKWTVFGTNGCGWTRKQLQLMDEKKVPYTFVNCDEEDCKGATAFPTLIDPSGKKIVGFNNLE